MLIAGDGLNTAEFMDLGATKTLTTAPVPGNLPVVMKGPVANLVAGKVVACGGAGVAGCYEYDFQVGDWAHLGDMPEVRSSSVDFVSNDGDTWYILGGRADATTPHTYHKTALAYHNGEFKNAGSMPYPAYAEAFGIPNSPDDYAAHRFVGPDDETPRTPYFEWLKEALPLNAMTFRSNNVASSFEAVKAGLGIGFLPRQVAEVMDCQAIRDPEPDWNEDIWAVTHMDLHRSSKVQALLKGIRPKR